jgi:hypothetical protein
MVNDIGKLTWGDSATACDSHKKALMTCGNPRCPESLIAYRDREYLTKNMVGICESSFYSSTDGSTLAIVLECPECFTRSWCHIGEGYAKQLNVLRAKLKDKE